MLKQNRKKFIFLIISMFLFAVFVSLAYLFPYSGDDWAWGTQIGIDRLNAHFVDYNGRYAGNLLVLVLTRSKVLNVAVMAVSYYLVCLFTYIYSNSRSIVSFLLSVLLFFCIPKEIFTQAIVWTSGFSNYVPPIIITVFYIISVKNIFNDNFPKYKKYFVPVFFVLGFIGCLFMENISIFNLLLSIAVLIYSRIKFKKTYAAHLSFFIASFIGNAVMFSNSSYLNIASGNDGYRSAAGSLKELFTVVIKHFYQAVNFLITDNLLLCAVITAVLCVLCISCIKKASVTVKLIKVIKLLLSVNVVSFVIMCFKGAVSKAGVNNKTLHYFCLGVLFAAAVLYLLSLAALLFICIDNKKSKIEILFPLFCIPVLIAPLLLVNPIGARNFFPSYFLLMMFTVSLSGYTLSRINIKLSYHNVLPCILSVCILVSCAFYFNIFSLIHTCNDKRNEFAKLQSDNGEQTIIICRLPNDSYIWTGNPDEEPWIERYKLFYDINPNSEFEYIDYAELDDAIDTYKETNN